jgi:hypothetical protein
MFAEEPAGRSLLRLSPGGHTSWCLRMQLGRAAMKGLEPLFATPLIDVVIQFLLVSYTFFKSL